MTGDHVTKSRGEAEPRWQARDGQPIACREKLKVLNENLDEMRRICQDALDDAVALGCDAENFRAVVRDMLARLESTLRSGKG